MLPAAGFEVMKGAEGWRLTGLVAISPILKAPARIAAPRAGIGDVGEPQLVDLLAVEVGQPGGEIAFCGGEVGVDAPVIPGLEGLDLVLALADEAQATDWTRPAERRPEACATETARG